MNYWFKFILSPPIFLALIISFIGRVLWSLPLQTKGAGIVAAILTPLTLVLIVIGSVILWKEPFSSKQILGFILAIISLILMEW